ncbi:alpha-ketoglutarate-dependent dioxygenase AlkB [Acinetobacter baumannii]
MDNLSFFDAPKPTIKIPDIRGVEYLSDFVSTVEETEILKNIDSQPWITDLGRRVQHYGYRYNYKKAKLDRHITLPPIPAWLIRMQKDLMDECSLDLPPNQLIINEYEPGQGITDHIDAPDEFGETIIMVSLGSSCVMDFLSVETNQKEAIFLEQRSLLMIRDDARYKWKHGIVKRKTDTWDGIQYPRSRRVSLTFRFVSK